MIQKTPLTHLTSPSISVNIAKDIAELNLFYPFVFNLSLCHQPRYIIGKQKMAAITYIESIRAS